MAGFNIEQFANQINKNGVLRNSRFFVRVFPPRILQNDQSYKNEVIKNIEFWCDSLSLPGVSMATSEIRRHGYGAAEKKPYLPIFNDIAFTFLCDSKSNILMFFHRWMNLISNFNSVQGISGTGTGVVANHSPYEVSYKDDYATEVEITIFRESGETSLKMKLRKAFPVSVGEIAMAWADTNGLLRIPVTITYLDWYEEK